MSAIEPQTSIPTMSKLAMLRSRPQWIVVLVLIALSGLASLAGFAVTFASAFNLAWDSGHVVELAIAVALVGGVACVALLAAFDSGAIVPVQRAAIGAAIPHIKLWAGLINTQTRASLQNLSTKPMEALRGYRVFILLTRDQIEFWFPSGSEFALGGAVERSAIIDMSVQLVSVARSSRTAVRLSVRDDRYSSPLYVDVIANPNREFFTIPRSFPDAVRSVLSDWLSSPQIPPQ